VVREQAALPLREGTRPLGLVGDAARVTGVSVARDNAAVETIQAVLVADATGRRSKTPRCWQRLELCSLKRRASSQIWLLHQTLSDVARACGRSSRDHASPTPDARSAQAKGVIRAVRRFRDVMVLGSGLEEGRPARRAIERRTVGPETFLHFCAITSILYVTLSGIRRVTSLASGLTMYSKLISFIVCAWLIAGTGAGFCDTITRTPEIFPLNSLALITGMVFDGTSIWIADINKQVVRLDANHSIAEHFNLDGDLGALAPGSGHTIYVTDPKTAWQISRDSSAVKEIPALGINNCSQESVAADGPFVWVVNACEVKNGSTNSVFSSLLLRIDPNTGERNLVTLATIGSGSNLLLINQGKVWVNGDDCSVVDENTLELKTFRPSGTTWVGPMAANTHNVFLSAVGPNAGPQFVIAFDPSTLQEIARTTIDLPIENITADEQNVVAFGQNQLYVLSASDLALQRIINIDQSLIQTHADAMFVLNGDLLIADDELGARIPNRILLFHDWR
jgi:hypothetical protein